jgi:hypothetical protein
MFCRHAYLDLYIYIDMYIYMHVYVLLYDHKSDNTYYIIYHVNIVAAISRHRSSAPIREGPTKDMHKMCLSHSTIVLSELR